MTQPPVPTERLVPADGGRDLVLSRYFLASAQDVWATLVDGSAQWFASWTGEADVGRTVRLTLLFEDGEPQGDLTIDACKPPHHLAATTSDAYGSWRLEVHIREEDGTTELRFIHHLTEAAGVTEIGPGWEYYLDRLVAAHNGAGEMPDFTDYYPSQREYYESVAESG